MPQSPFAAAAGYQQTAGEQQDIWFDDLDLQSLYEQAASETVAVRSELNSQEQLLLHILMRGQEDRLAAFDPDAPGSLVLTDEQIDLLRERYDPDSMTSKQFRSLLLDLVDMGVLSAQDALGTGIMAADPDRPSGYLVEVGSEEAIELERLLQLLADSYLKDWISKADREPPPERKMSGETRSLVESHQRVREVLTTIFPDAPVELPY